MEKTMRKKSKRPFWPLILLLLLIMAAAAGVHHVRATAAAPDADSFLYLPVVSKPLNCDTPVNSYDALYTIGGPGTLTPETNESYNLGYRGYEPTTAPLMLVELGPVHDAKAPQFNTMFTDERLPTFSNAYHRYRWINGQPVDTTSRWDVTVLGLATTPGEIIRVPNSGYDVGGGNDALVLYADEQRVTLKYTGEDNIIYGYTIYIEGFCVDPDLLALYQQLHGAGREQLPAVPGRVAIGRAAGPEVKVAILDTGSFLDPRSCNDWWQAVNGGC